MTGEDDAGSWPAEHGRAWQGEASRSVDSIFRRLSTETARPEPRTWPSLCVKALALKCLQYGIVDQAIHGGKSEELACGGA